MFSVFSFNKISSIQTDSKYQYIFLIIIEKKEKEKEKEKESGDEGISMDLLDT